MGHMGHAFWTCPLKVAGVGMRSPRLARIIGFLECTECILISTQSPAVFAVWILYCTKKCRNEQEQLKYLKIKNKKLLD